MKKIIEEEIFNYLNHNTIKLNEFLDKEHGLPLKKYLSMGQRDKNIILLKKYPNLINVYFKDLLDKNIIDNKTFSDVNNNNIESIINKLTKGKLKKYLNNLMGFIRNNVKYSQDIPANETFTETSLVKNQWLIHFTNDAISIAENGFKYGTNNLETLNFTNAMTTDGKGEGYNFAYLLSDYKKYYQVYKGLNKYGNEAVIFQASGVRVWHTIDEEHQVIFWGDSAKNIIPIIQVDKSKWSILSSKTNKPLITMDSLDDIIKWAVNNIYQYRKHINYKRK